MKIKVAEATNLQLDWLVAVAQGLTQHNDALLNGQIMRGWWFSGYYPDPNIWTPLRSLPYSTNWAEGGPIIEREKISLGSTFTGPEGSFAIQTGWYAYRHIYGGVINPPRYTGSTPLSAAMRCYVASKLGNEVTIPKELV